MGEPKRLFCRLNVPAEMFKREDGRDWVERRIRHEIASKVADSYVIRMDARPLPFGWYR